MGETFTVFDGNDVKERRFIPYELKEIGFKYSLISGLLWTNNYCFCIDPMLDIAASLAMVTGAGHAIRLMSASVSRIGLHRDGKSVTLVPRIGSPFTVKIKDIRKLRDEKDLV